MMYSLYSPGDALIVRNIYEYRDSLSVCSLNETKLSRYKCYLQCFTSHHHLPPPNLVTKYSR